MKEEATYPLQQFQLPQFQFNDQGHPEYIWYVLAAHIGLGALVFLLFSRFGGGFAEQAE